MKTEIFFSSENGVWETPQKLFDELNEEFDFGIDVCALPENAKCEKYYTPEHDGLRQPWVGNVWCNPPYGRGIERWLEKAQKSVTEGAKVVVMLLPVRTNTKWFHEYIYNKAEIRFIRGKLKFSNHKDPAPFPSMLAIFRAKEEEK